MVNNDIGDTKLFIHGEKVSQVKNQIHFHIGLRVGLGLKIC
jgi:hypothetical protein